MVRVWAKAPAAVAAEAWGEAEDKVTDESAVAWAKVAGVLWVLRATARDLPAGRPQGPPQLVGEHREGKGIQKAEGIRLLQTLGPGPVELIQYGRGRKCTYVSRRLS